MAVPDGDPVRRGDELEEGPGPQSAVDLGDRGRIRRPVVGCRLGDLPHGATDTVKPIERIAGTQCATRVGRVCKASLRQPFGGCSGRRKALDICNPSELERVDEVESGLEGRLVDVSGVRVNSHGNHIKPLDWLPARGYSSVTDFGGQSG